MAMTSYKFKLPEEVLKAVHQRAADQDRSTAAYIRQLIKADLQSAGEQQLQLIAKPKTRRG